MVKICSLLGKFALSMSIVAALLGETSQAIEDLQPYIDPKIGDTLDVVEKEQYGFFKSENRFRWALFYITPDSILYAAVATTHHDTVQYRNVKYGSVSKLRRKLTGPEAKSEYLWANSFYIAGGLGKPLGRRLEGGYNFGHAFSLGVTRVSDVEWPYGSLGSDFLGLQARLYVPVTPPPYSPYILFAQSSQLSPWGDSDVYYCLGFGGIIPFARIYAIRPEMGIISTHGKFADSDNIFFEFNVALEIDFMAIFKKQN